MKFININKNLLILNMDNAISIVKKKKGRPRKIQLDVQNTLDENLENKESVVVVKKKRGRKKKEQVEEVIKQKKKRGRKAAVKFFSSSIRKRIPLTTIIQDNDKSILHIDIKDSDIDSKKELYNLIEDETAVLNSSIEVDKNNSSITSGYDNKLNTECSINSENKILIDQHIEGNINENKEMDYPLIELYEKRLQARIAQDNKLIEQLENIHNHEELLEELHNNNLIGLDEIKDTLSLSKNNSSNNNKINNNVQNGSFNVLTDFIENTNWLDHTDVCCWWCCHKFDTIPIGMPVEYDKNKSKKFIVKGIFCSFACMIAYGQDNRKKHENFKALTSFLYKKLTGGLQVSSKESYKNDLNILLKDEIFGDVLDPQTKIVKQNYINNLANLTDSPLTPAPPRCTLKMFGGKLSINEFRNSTKERKVYKMIEYPMSISRDYVEEVDLENIKHINMNVFATDKKKDTDKKNNLEELKLYEIKMDNAKSRITNTNKDNVIASNNINKFITF